MLSIESPISASTSTTCSGDTPNFSFTPAASNQVPSSLRVVDLDPVVHQLEEVLVAGDDRHLEAGIGGLLRQRPDHVVSLVPLRRENRHAHRLARLVHPRNLLSQIRRHR